MPSVSIVIACYNPDGYLLDAVASARNQTHPDVEVIVVDDGSDAPASSLYLKTAGEMADRFVRQANRGVSAARNAGIRMAAGAFIVALDADDLLMPDFVAACLAALQEHPAAAFAYSDYRVVGNRNYVERLPDYNLFDLMEANTLPCVALVRAADCREAGGYNESLLAHEDWEYWLRLGGRGRFGHHVRQTLWCYRKSGSSLSDYGLRHHSELVADIRSLHPELYSETAYAEVKKRWRPSVCVVGPVPAVEQTILDWSVASPGTQRDLLNASPAETFFFPKSSSTDPRCLELAVIAAAGRNRAVQFADGAMVASRKVLARTPEHTLAKGRFGEEVSTVPMPPTRPPSRFVETLWRHLHNAEVLSLGAWRHHPLRSFLRLVPLRWKESVNRVFGRQVFDLTFYLRFQPGALVVREALVHPVRYVPRMRTAPHRVAIVTPGLGPGGAEAVLLDIAGTLDRSRYEILLIATQSTDSRWVSRWSAVTDHIYDLHSVTGHENVDVSLLSIIRNWKCDTLLLQNSLAGYAVLPHVRKELPEIRIIDVIHSVDESWNIVSCTAVTSDFLDTRVAISGSARDQLLSAGTPPGKVCVIHNGVDLDHFRCCPEPGGAGPARILFAGRLDTAKQPLLLVKIAAALARQRPAGDFVFVVAGDGPLADELQAAVRRSGQAHLFELLGHVPDLAGELVRAAMLIIPSRSEGIPMVLLEAMATGRPVVASNVGAIGEALDSSAGYLIDRGPGLVREFCAAIDALLSNSSLRREMGRCGRRNVELKFDKLRTLDEYRKLLETVLPVKENATRHAAAGCES